MLNTLVEIFGSASWQEVELIDKGWSGDKKYAVTCKDGKRLLLRLSDAQSYKRKIYEFEFLKAVAGLSIRASKPLDLGRLADGRVYTLLTWVDGQDLQEVLPGLSEAEHYRIGRQAGAYLKLIHGLDGPVDVPKWADRMNDKLDDKIKKYKRCQVSFEGDEAMMAYIDAHRHLLKGRPQSLQHGDYHCGNMVINEDLALGLVDFNRCDYGDPWEEFNRIVWDADLSPTFASARLHAYFDGDPPLVFFELLALYMAGNTLGSIPWAQGFGDEDIRTMLNQAKQVVAWYDGYTRCIPTWYQKAPTEEFIGADSE